MTISNWSDYRDMVEWNRSFGLQPQRDQVIMDEDDIHHIFSLMQYGLCDMEIAHLTLVHICIINRMRVGAVHSEVGGMYDYPIVFTPEMMHERIKRMVIEEGLDPVEIASRTGVDHNSVIHIYNQYRGINNHNV